VSETIRSRRASGSEDDPIIAIKRDNRYEVCDGNSRLIQTIERCAERGNDSQVPRLKAWLGEGTADRNYWIPTTSLRFLKDHVFSKERIVTETELRVYPLAWTEYQKRCAA
jgi:hypothetical protein